MGPYAADYNLTLSHSWLYEVQLSTPTKTSVSPIIQKWNNQ
jgi:hypothetical protein